MRTIPIPAQINASGLLPFLAQLGQPVDEAGVRMDFSGLRRVTPPGLVALVAAMLHLRREHRPVEFAGLSACPITGYLQRMDALRACGIELPETFARHDASGRFVPVRLVDHRVDEMGRDISACLAPGGGDYDHPNCGLYDFSWYVLTEVANNIRQHSGGLGFASAQVSREEGLVRLALADNGMGILGSFRDAGFPWSREMSDMEAIRKALEPKVSCKIGEPNEGVGLTLVSEMAKLTRSWLLIVSGRGVLQMSAGREPVLTELPDGGDFHGTLMTMVFRQNAARDYPSLLNKAKIRAGLLRIGRASGRFRE